MLIGFGVPRFGDDTIKKVAWGSVILVHKVNQELFVSSSYDQVTEGMWGGYVLKKATTLLTLLIMFGAYSIIEPTELPY